MQGISESREFLKVGAISIGVLIDLIVPHG